MESKYFLYNLLYFCLVDIRAEAYNVQSNKITWTSGLVHNLPLKLLRAKSEEDFEMILDDLEKAIKHDNMEEWLSFVKTSIEKQKELQDFQNRK